MARLDRLCVTRRRLRRAHRAYAAEMRANALYTRRNGPPDYAMTAAQWRESVPFIEWLVGWTPGADRGHRTGRVDRGVIPRRFYGCGCDSCESGYCCGWAPPAYACDDDRGRESGAYWSGDSAVVE